MKNLILKSLSSMKISEVEGEDRTFVGVASTSDVDRAGDILSPTGAKYTLPLPLLLQHNHDLPVGYVTEAEVTDKEIRVKFVIPLIEEEGELKRIVDKAYQSLKYGLIKGLSVGFIGDFDQAEYIASTDGVLFKSWEWYELSLVTIPCNPNAGVSKSLLQDHEQKKSCIEEKTVVESSHIQIVFGKTAKSGVKFI